MTGRHAAEPRDGRPETPPAPDPGTAEQSGSHALSPGSEISPDTHIGSDQAVAAGTQAEASPARPEQLVEGNLVGDGTELE
jgi:hypothetical protein